MSILNILNPLRANTGRLLLYFLISMSGVASAQTIPFGTNNSYSYGYMAAGASDATATAWYNSWKSNYVKDCSPNGKLIVYNAGGNSGYSEGQGYGMLLAAYNGDQALFNDLWKLYKARSNSHGLMNWDVSCTANNQANGATDGDLDAAMALLIAKKQWPSATSPYDYGAEATTLITNIYNYETNLSGNANGAPSCTGADSNPLAVLRPGDAFANGTTCTCINLSYFAPAYYRAFAQHVPSQASEWTRLANDSYKLINWNKDASSGLVTAWTRANGTVPTPSSAECSYSATGGGGPSSYQYDAARTPWRIATDYLWWGTAAADTWLTQVGNWSNGVGAANIVDGYNHNGTAYSSYKNSAFTGAFALAQMAITQGQTDSWYTYWSTKSSKSGYSGSDKLDDAPYFQNSLATMYMFLATGNFWNPYNGTCRQPDLGADLSTCSGTTLPATLSSGTVTASGVTYTWYRNGTVISGQTGINCSGCGTVVGTYVVVRDSTGGCSKRDTVLISNTIPTPTITGPLTLCTPASYNLTPTNAASFPSGVTWQWAVDYSGGTTYNNLTGETASTLSNVRTAGRYRITATAGSCTSNGNVVVTSSNPTPVDGCISAAGNVNLSIANPGLTGTNYNWYTTASGSTLATTVPAGNATASTSVTVNVSATTTFYVQDMSSVNATVGPYFPSQPSTYTGGANVGADNQIETRFEAIGNFSISTIYMPYMLYNASEAAKLATFEIVDDATGNVITTSTQYTGAMASGSFGSQGAYVIRFNVNIPVTGGTSASPAILRIRLSGSSNSGNPYLFNDNVDPFDGSMPLAWKYVDNQGGNTMRLIGSRIYSTATTSRYGFFVGFNISAGTGCARVPVIARVSSGCTSAPVELVSFYADKGEGRTVLNWVTASELNNDYFNVERSLDGETFEVISKVKGQGTISGISLYSFADEQTPSGKAYYRLTQVDYDGTATRSHVISVEQGIVSLEVQAAPNPFTNSTDVHIKSALSDKARVVLTDLSGLHVYSGLHSTNESVSIGQNIAAGVYILQVYLQDQIKTIRIVKQ